MTVEDPIEFLHRHQSCLVNQREVGEDTKSFANALKHVLRQDPDIILVGEMRDLETISVALTAAETGHLVFATLHTQDAAQTIDRVIDVFPPHQQQQVRVQLAGSLQGVVCQTLARTADGKGRAVATEVLVATPAIRNLIREGKTHQIYSRDAGRRQARHAHAWTSTWPTWSTRAASRTRPASRSATTSRTSTGSPAGAEAGQSPWQPRRRSSTRSATGPARSSRARSRRTRRPRWRQKLKSMGYAPVSITEAQGGGMKTELTIPGFGAQGQAQGPRDHVAAVRDDDQLRPVAAARADHPRGADREQGARRGPRPRCATTSRPVSALSGALAKHPEVFPPLMVNMIPRRRGRRLPRRRPAADRRELRGRGQAARQDQVAR